MVAADNVCDHIGLVHHLINYHRNRDYWVSIEERNNKAICSIITIGHDFRLTKVWLGYYGGGGKLNHLGG